MKTIGDILDLFEDMDPDEPVAFHFITHSEMHEAADAAGIPITCSEINRALVIYENMLEHKVGMDPMLLFKAMGRAATLEKQEAEPVTSTVH